MVWGPVGRGCLVLGACVVVDLLLADREEGLVGFVLGGCVGFVRGGLVGLVLGANVGFLLGDSVGFVLGGAV